MLEIANDEFNAFMRSIGANTIEPIAHAADNRRPQSTQPSGIWWGVTWNETMQNIVKSYGPPYIGRITMPQDQPEFFLREGQSIRVRAFRPDVRQVKAHDVVLFAVANDLGPWDPNAWGYMHEERAPRRAFAYIGVGDISSVYVGRGRSRMFASPRRFTIADYAGRIVQSRLGRRLCKTTGRVYYMRPLPDDDGSDRGNVDDVKGEGHIVAVLDL